MLVEAAPAMPTGQTINREILLNVTAECNFRCTYCHWFRDPTVLEQPPLMPPEVERAFLHRLEEHILSYDLTSLTIVIHGGEPLLFGKARFRSFLDEVEAIADRCRCAIRKSMTTNGSLVDAEWIAIFQRYGISITISIDGPREVHDGRRLSLSGNGTHERVVRGIKRIQEAGGIRLTTLSVCDPASDPVRVLHYFFESLKVSAVDFLIPKINHDDARAGRYQAIAPFYIRLFDAWYDTYWPQGRRVRIADEIVSLLMGKMPVTHSLRADRMTHVCVSPDGTIEPLDNIRIGGNDRVNTGLNVINNRIDDVLTNRLWLETYNMARTLPPGCQDCEYVDCCHGGFIACRWSSANGYNNRTVYCQDIQSIFSHAWRRIRQDLVVGQLGIIER